MLLAWICICSYLYIHIYIYILIYVKIYIGMYKNEREWETLIYYEKSSVHTVLEAEKSKDLQSANWRTRRTDDLSFHWQPSPRAEEVQFPTWRQTGREREFLYFILFLIIFIVILLQLFQFSSLCLPLPIPPPTPTGNPHTAVHVHGSFKHVLWLVPSPSFHHYPPLPAPRDTSSLFHVSMPVFLFCSFILFIRFLFYVRSYGICLPEHLILFESSVDWIWSLHTRESNLLYSVYGFKC